MAKLTKAQVKILSGLKAGPLPIGFLRRGLHRPMGHLVDLGLVWRFDHEWRITPAGLTALAQQQGERE